MDACCHGPNGIGGIADGSEGGFELGMDINVPADAHDCGRPSKLAADPMQYADERGDGCDVRRRPRPGAGTDRSRVVVGSAVADLSARRSAQPRRHCDAVSGCKSLDDLSVCDIKACREVRSKSSSFRSHGSTLV
jgi:hypothetical protein